MANSNFGICALHKGEPTSLCMSHLTPKGVHRITGGASGKPIHVNPVRGTVLYSNDQTKQHALCSMCEGLFDKFGENIVLANCANGSTFRLRDMISAIPCHEPSSWYGTLLPPNLNAAAYAYFAISMVWRASTIEWNSREDAYYFGALRPKYEKIFAQFLLGERPLPDSVQIHVAIWSNTSASLLFARNPTRDTIRIRGSRLYVHSFAIPGMEFRVLIGPPAQYTASENLMNLQPVFRLEDLAETGVIQSMYRAASQTAPKTKFAKDPLASNWPNAPVAV